MKSRVVKSSFIISENKIKASYFLLKGAIYEEIIRSKPYEELNELLDYCSNIGGVNKRIYVNPKYGTPFMSMTDMMSQHPTISCKYISNKISNNTSKHIFKKDMILGSVVGAIGDVCYVNKTTEGSVTGNNIIKIFSKRPNYNGFLYAYLSSKFGNAIIKKLGGGAVQSYVDPELFKKIPIPLLPNNFIEKVNNLISESSKLREEKNNILENVQIELFKELKISNVDYNDFEYYGPKSPDRSVRVFTINKNKIDINSLKPLNYSKGLKLKIKELTLKNKILPLKDVINEKGLYHSSAFKRVKVNKSKGVELLSQSEIFKFHIKGKRISSMYPLEADYAVEDEILISGVGGLGEGDSYCRCVLVKKNLTNKVLVGEFIRLKANKVLSGYLYAWLSSDFVYRLLRSYSSGAILFRPIPYFVEQIPVPILSPNFMNKLNTMVHKAFEYQLEAIDLEKKAINMIEKEIESWQK